MTALVFLFPKGQAPEFGIRFSNKEEALNVNFLWPNIKDGWQAKIELEGVRLHLTVWLPNSNNKHTYTVYEWDRQGLRRFLNECGKITAVSFFHAVKHPEGDALIAVMHRQNESWKINICNIQLKNLVKESLGIVKEWPKY